MARYTAASGKLTTCDRPNPHYHFQVSRMMVIPDDKIVTGPAYMKVGKVPTPLALPFGLFPNKKGGSSRGADPHLGQQRAAGLLPAERRLVPPHQRPCGPAA